MKIIRYLLIILSFVSATSCAGSQKSIKDAIDWNMIFDEYSIIKDIDVDGGQIVFLERQTFKDIGVAFVNSSRNTAKTSVSGFLSQNENDPNWYYSFSNLDEHEYSVYFGRLDEAFDENIYIQLENKKIKEKATLMGGSLSTLWFIVFDERVEDHQISIIYED